MSQSASNIIKKYAATPSIGIQNFRLQGNRFACCKNSRLAAQKKHKEN